MQITNLTHQSVNTKSIKRALKALLKNYNKVGKNITVVLTGNDHIAELNKQFRNIDKPTDVLSFKSEEFEHLPLGEIVISLPYAIGQAQQRGVDLNNELAFLAIHGGLHLLGFNDESEKEHQDMIKRMNEIALIIDLPIDQEWKTILL